MILSIKEDNLTVSIEFQETDEVKPSASDVLIGAYYSTDPDTMDFRCKDDDFLKHVKFFGYDDRKED